MSVSAVERGLDDDVYHSHGWSSPEELVSGVSWSLRGGATGNEDGSFGLFMF
jgi:hypothetical protein